MSDNEVTKGGANVKKKGVHVTHEYDQFENVTYSSSTWQVNAHDPKENILRFFVTMERRVWDDGKVKNMFEVRMCHHEQYGASLREVQFNADGTSILTKNTYYNLEPGVKKQFKKGKKVYTQWRGKKGGCPITDEELKTICDASNTNIRIIAGARKSAKYYDISDQRTVDVVEFMKCYYRECIDNNAYPEVADMLPPKPKKKMQIPWWYWVVGILILGGIANLAGY